MSDDLAVSYPDQCCPDRYCVEAVGLHRVSRTQAEHVVAAIEQREQAAVDAALAPIEALIDDGERMTYSPHTIYTDDLRAVLRDARDGA